jgi:dolichol-phosphate mannosyltransferase
MKKILVFTATYNESGNIERLVKEVFQHLPNCQMLVVDDHSPDGTGQILNGLTARNSQLNVIHRPGKLGLGTAHLLAMKYALEKDFDFLITMDADFSHDPKYLKEFINRTSDFDFIIGSRYIKGGRCDYGFVRTMISLTANFLTRLLLGIKLRETTTSYRCFSKSLLKKLATKKIDSEGYSFFVESIFLVNQLTDKMTEFPIEFLDRVAGETKISRKEIYKGMTNLFRLFLKRLKSHA